MAPKNVAMCLINFEAQYTGCYFLLAIIMCIIPFLKKGCVNAAIGSG
jgi:hypothetical protein